MSVLLFLLHVCLSLLFHFLIYFLPSRCFLSTSVLCKWELTIDLYVYVHVYVHVNVHVYVCVFLCFRSHSSCSAMHLVWGTLVSLEILDAWLCFCGVECGSCVCTCFQYVRVCQCVALLHILTHANSKLKAKVQDQRISCIAQCCQVISGDAALIIRSRQFAFCSIMHY